MDDLSISLLGYNRNQVHHIISNKTSRIEELEMTVSTLENKVNELEAQLSQYHELESTLKDGIIDARIKGNEIVEASSVKASEIIHQTNEQVIQYKEELAHHSQELIDNGLVLKNSLNNMKQEMYKIMSRFNNVLDETDFEAVYPDTQVKRLTMQLEELSYEQISLNQEDETTSLISDSTLTDEEKLELEKLIHEVIANEATKETPKEPIKHEANESDQKQVDLRVVKG